MTEPLVWLSVLGPAMGFVVVFAAILSFKPQTKQDLLLGRRGHERSRARSQSVVFVLLSGVCAWLPGGRYILPEKSRLHRHIEERLQRAGYWLGLFPVEWSMLCTITLGSTALGILLAHRFGNIVLPWWAAALLLGLSVLAPYGHLVNLGDKRFKQIMHEFPDLLDWLYAGLSSGGNLTTAIRDYGAWSDPKKASWLARELRWWLYLIDTGTTQTDGWTALAANLPGLKYVSDFAEIVAQAATSGTSIAEPLADLKAKIREEQENQALASIEAMSRSPNMPGNVMMLGIFVFFVAIAYLKVGPIFTELGLF